MLQKIFLVLMLCPVISIAQIQSGEIVYKTKIVELPDINHLKKDNPLVYNVMADYQRKDEIAVPYLEFVLTFNKMRPHIKERKL